MGLLGPMPSFELENQTQIATEVISSDGVVIGKYFQKQISVKVFRFTTNLVQTLVATEG
jgi:penicillin-binding protein 1A